MSDLTVTEFNIVELERVRLIISTCPTDDPQWVLGVVEKETGWKLTRIEYAAKVIAAIYSDKELMLKWDRINRVLVKKRKDGTTYIDTTFFNR